MRGLTDVGLRVPAKAGRQDTRTTNRRLVLQHLLAGEPLSRADLSRATDLTAATVSALVAELDEAGLVTDVGPRRDDAQVGKPPTMMRIRAEARHVIALDLASPTTWRAAVVDLLGRIGARVEVPAEAATGEEAIIKVKELASAAVELAASPILGVGVGTSGVVPPRGVVAEASNIDWHGSDLSGRLEAATGHPTHVSNDANVAAIAEYTRGGHDCTSLALIKIGSGVRAGLVLDGHLYGGENAAAGEIGHFVVDPDGPPCRCGQRGCLETFVAVPNIQGAIGRNEDETEAARRVAAEQLGTALAAIVAILDLDHILVDGPRAVLGDDFCAEASAALRARSLGPAASVSVDYAALGPDIVLLGAAGLVLSQELGVA